MVNRVTKLGGTASGITVRRVSHGLMMMWPTFRRRLLRLYKAGIDALPAGAKAFLNSGEFYSATGGTENLELLSRFYAKHPEYVDKTFLSVKGAMVGGQIPDCSYVFIAFNRVFLELTDTSGAEGLRKSVENITKALGPHKKLDLFQPARMDPKVTPEDMMQEGLVALLKEGYFLHIGFSECNATTLRRAHAVHPVTAAEIEVSLWVYEQEQQVIIATASELGVSVSYLRPIGHGFLTASITSQAEVPKGDFRAHLTRFNEENLPHNLRIVAPILALAQLCIAWVAALGLHVIPLPGKVSRTLENLQGDIELSSEEMVELNALAAGADIRGHRYLGGSEGQYLFG
ncbi:aldo/keto reductase [Roridomyces roridus]|uniref:Aldo/keto reductase n=1 Tax=Roridomyces roridus TaxID=1738132 RepID=A0AAD7BRW0_9AGAR|nr:aldo/keto reductase [Roridomyces roridus]